MVVLIESVWGPLTVILVLASTNYSSMFELTIPSISIMEESEMNWRYQALDFSVVRVVPLKRLRSRNELYVHLTRCTTGLLEQHCC